MRRGSHCFSGPSGQGKINASAWCIDVGPDIKVTDNPIINSVVCSQLCHFPPSLPPSFAPCVATQYKNYKGKAGGGDT